MLAQLAEPVIDNPAVLVSEGIDRPKAAAAKKDANPTNTASSANSALITNPAVLQRFLNVS